MAIPSRLCLLECPWDGGRDGGEEVKGRPGAGTPSPGQYAKQKMSRKKWEELNPNFKKEEKQRTPCVNGRERSLRFRTEMPRGHQRPGPRQPTEGSAGLLHTPRSPHRHALPRATAGNLGASSPSMLLEEEQLCRGPRAQSERGWSPEPPGNTPLTRPEGVGTGTLAEEGL